jgi:hypothetical protein
MRLNVLYFLYTFEGMNIFLSTDEARRGPAQSYQFPSGRAAALGTPGQHPRSSHLPLLLRQDPLFSGKFLYPRTPSFRGKNKNDILFAIRLASLNFLCHKLVF